MSFKFVMTFLLQQMKNRRKKESPITLFEKRLNKIQFKDISSDFPNEYFLLQFDPLYTFYKIINRKDIVFLNKTCTQTESLLNLLGNIFSEKEVGMKRLFFSDFSGMTASKESGKYSFEDFKEEQYNRNLSDLHYDKYDSVRYEVFNTDREGSANFLKNAIIVKWSNSIYANNSDRSHRFALLCKWDEINNRKDSELFNTREISINEEKKKEFLGNYHGFIIHSETASEIIKTYTNNSLMNWKMYCPFYFSRSGELVGFLFNRQDVNQEIIEIFLQSKNCVYINSLFENLPKSISDKH